MARKQPKKNRIHKNSQPAGKPLASLNTAFQKAYSAGKFAQALEVARQMTNQQPANAKGWVAKADAHARLKEFSDAIACMERVKQLSGGFSSSHQLKLAQYQVLGGQASQAVPTLLELTKQQEKIADVYSWLSQAYHVQGKNEQALEANDRALELDQSNIDTLLWRSRILDNLRQPGQAKETLLKVKKLAPKKISVNNHLGSLAMREGEYEEAENYFYEELKLQDNSQVFSNLIIAQHYNPDNTAEKLKSIHEQWAKKYQLKNVERPPSSAVPAKRIRLGLLSGGFRVHPVGQMVLSALENLSPQEFELFFYSTNQVQDPITEKVIALASDWKVVENLTNERLSDIIASDGIDILLEMNGGGDGSRYQAISSKPAPLIVKWVGMQINTTGLDAVDYFLSDHIETPQGSDHLYCEKLIRLPDDYVCYQLPSYIAPVNSLPALSNQYITFGCLNNPAKLSPPLIKEWSQLLHEIPSSKLLLRGVQFEGDAFKRKIIERFAKQGIDENRLVLEGPARHEQFLTTYQRIDIALDTWPYSGGLTTCEALAMGVPVVTCVGPTFAGRHSATHLANAGLPELVTDNWDDFRQRAKELASDLPSLAVIRAALRTILKESPVCDGARFAQHFTKAMRGIWQRHCESKAPEALSFNKDGDAWFADEAEPVTLMEVETAPVPSESSFEWHLDSPITVIDNGALFARHPNFREWIQTGNFAVISFDPGSLLTNQADELKALGEWHHYPHATLGDGSDATLYATLDPDLTGTVEPLSACQTGEQEDPLRVLSTLPMSTVPLNAIEGLPGVDMLVLDGLNKAMPILENGEDYLQHSLLIKANVVFQPTHAEQPALTSIERWAKTHGFRLYTLCHLVRSQSPHSRLAAASDVEELLSADAVFIPELQRIKQLSDKDKWKLAYVLAMVHGSDKVAYDVLSTISPELAKQYEDSVRESPADVAPAKTTAINSIEKLMGYLEKARLNKQAANHSLPGHLIVSLTSYGARFKNLHYTLRSLLLQKTRPDRLILWIAESEKDELPEAVLKLKDYGLDIRFCEDIRSYKKIIPTIREFPDSFIVTADDDIYYAEDWLESLIESWNVNKGNVIAHRAHKIKFDEKGSLLPYRHWGWHVGSDEPADGLVFPTGCGGVLYPPNVFHSEVTNTQKFMYLCPSTDDVWLYWMTALNGVNIKPSNYNFRLIEWPNEDGEFLWKENVQGGRNDKSIQSLINEYGAPWEKQDKFISELAKNIKILAFSNDVSMFNKMSNRVGSIVRVWPFDEPPADQGKTLSIVPNMLLGDGRPSYYYVCENSAYNSALQPRTEINCKVLQQVPVNTATLNDFYSFFEFDWLCLDNFCDLEGILNNAEQALSEISLIQVNVSVSKTHKGQSSMIEIVKKLSGMSFKLVAMADVKKPDHDNYRLRFTENAKSVNLVFVQAGKNLDVEKRDKIKYVLDEVLELSNY